MNNNISCPIIQGAAYKRQMKNIKTLLRKGISMEFFTAGNGKLIFENNGETLQIEAWGENSLRIRSRMMGEILDTDYALLPFNGDVEAEIEINNEAQTASIASIKTVR